MTSRQITLPVMGSLQPAFAASLVVAGLMTAISLAGLLWPTAVYPTLDLQQAFIANDLVNVLVGLPALLTAMWWTRNGRLPGLLLWPGALLYVLYNYLAYTFARPFDRLTLVYLILALLSVILSLFLLWRMDRAAIYTRLNQTAPRKSSGWALVIFGVLFLFRTAGVIAEARMNQTPLSGSEMGVLIADTTLSILWVSGGVLLLLRRAMGYAAGLGLLFAASLLFVGLILFLLLQPALTGAPFVWVDILVIAAMGLFCFIPFALFLQEVRRADVGEDMAGL